MNVSRLPANLEANLWKLKFDTSGTPVPTKRWVYADNEKIMYWKSDLKPKHMSKIPPKKIFQLANCALSTTIIPPLKQPRAMMFQVFDKVENDSMIFAANTPDEYDMWMAFLKQYCILRPPLLGMEANLWKIKFSPDGTAVPTRRWVYADDEKIMYWKAHPKKHDDSKPFHMNESLSKKVFLLQNCVVSTNIVPPMNPPRPNMFQVSDLANDENMVFGAEDDQQFEVWIKFMRKYCRYGKTPLPREVEPEPEPVVELPMVAIADIVTDFFFQNALHVLPDPENPRISGESLGELLRIIAPHMGDSAVQLIFMCLLKDQKNPDESMSLFEFRAWWAEYTLQITADPSAQDAPLSPARPNGSSRSQASVASFSDDEGRGGPDGEFVPSTKVDLLFQTNGDAVTLPKLFPLRSRDQPLAGGFMGIWDTHQRATQFVSPYALAAVKQPVLASVQREWNIVCNLPTFVGVGAAVADEEEDEDDKEKPKEELPWNAMYQILLDRVHEPADAIPIGQTEEETAAAVSLLRNFDLSALKGKFHTCALQGVRTIVRELVLPRSQKTIVPVGVNPNEEPDYAGREEQAHVQEAHEHATYIHHGLVFRVVSAEAQVTGSQLASDFKKQEQLTIGDDILHKTAGQELRAAHALQSATTAIRYHGMIKATGKPLTSALPWLMGSAEQDGATPMPGAAKAKSLSIDPESVLHHTAKSHAWFERKQKEPTRMPAPAKHAALPCPSLMLSTLVDYCGFRVEVVAPVDLHASSLAYGFNLKTADRNSSFVSTVKNINPWIKEVGAQLGVKPCSVGELRGVKGDASDKSHPLDAALFLSKSMHMHRCPSDKRIYCTGMHDLLPNDLPRSGTTDLLTRFLRPEFAASAGAEVGGLAAGAFRHYDDSPQWDFSAACSASRPTVGRFQSTLSKCKEVYTKRLPSVAAQLDKLEYIPVDSYQLTKLMHMHGCNCRLLGDLFELVQAPHCKFLVMSEIVARACKSVLNNSLRMITRQQKSTSSDVKTALAEHIHSASVAETYVNFFNLILGGSDAGHAVWTGVLADAVHKHFDINLHFEDGSAPFIHIPQLFVAMQYHCGITFRDRCVSHVVQPSGSHGELHPLVTADVEAITASVKVSTATDCPDAAGLIQRVTALGDAYALAGMYAEALNAYRIRLSLLHLAYPSDNTPFNGEVQTFPGDNNMGNTVPFTIGKTQTNELKCPKLQAIFDEVSYKILHCQYQLGEYQAVLAGCKRELFEQRVLREQTYAAFWRDANLGDASASSNADATSSEGGAGLAYFHSMHCVRILSLLMCAEYQMQNVRKSTLMYEAACAICNTLLGGGHPLLAVLASTLSDLYKGSEALQQSLIMKLHAHRVVQHAMGSKSLVLASIACDVGDMYQLAHRDSLDSQEHAVASYTGALAVHTERLGRFKLKGQAGPNGAPVYDLSSEDCKKHMLAVVKCSYKLAVIAGRSHLQMKHEAALKHANLALAHIDALLASAEHFFHEKCGLSEVCYEVREAFNLRHLKVDCLSLIGDTYVSMGEYPAAINAYADSHFLMQKELRGENFAGVVRISTPPKLSRDFSLLIRNTLSAVLMSFTSTENKLLLDHVADVNKCRTNLRIEFIEAYKCAVEFLIQFLWEIDNPALYFQVVMAKMAKYHGTKSTSCHIDLNGLDVHEGFFDTTSTVLLESCEPNGPSRDVSLRVFISCVLQATVIVNLVRGDSVSK